MNKLCNEVQEQIALGHSLSNSQSMHLNQCAQCQSTFANYQVLVTAFTQYSNIAIPENFADNIMAKVYEFTEQKDWFENLLARIESWSNIKLVEYSYLTAGVGLGIFSFIRFIAFIFIPVG